ncbi:NAD(P)-dependent oxidoreductase [Dyadobacter sp. NIV53]|uniref:NAD(P)-dependent oxidoreductase n=1 Tax=Dyadobacter sp. NIV53 TaxID=2861765 RepID=UPI002104444A|nr:NAD(P)-dependent oxidoreductase [Dyadobacter sp. NIV53]
MIVYCHSSIDEALRSKLTDALSPKHVIHFSADINDNEAQNIFQTADFILGNPPVEWFENKPANLKFWQLDSAGFDQYSAIGLDKNVKVANMGNWFARPCAETIVGGILTLYRGLDTLIHLKEQTEWIGAKLRSELRILHEQNAVILGAGTIGQSVNAILKGFGCYTHLLARTSPDADLHSREDLFHELPYADLVINTLPGTATHFVNGEFLRQ